MKAYNKKRKPKHTTKAKMDFPKWYEKDYMIQYKNYPRIFKHKD